MSTTTTKTILNPLFERHSDAALDVLGIISDYVSQAMIACETLFRGEVSDPDHIKDMAEKIKKWASHLGDYADGMPRTPLNPYR